MRYKTLLLLLHLNVFLAEVTAAQHRRPLRPSSSQAEYGRQKQAFTHTGYPNVITISIPVFGSLAGGGVIGLGAEYERFVSRNGLLSVHLPFYIYSPVNLGNSKTGSRYTQSSAMFIAPGIRIHPMANTHRADLSFGAQYAVGTAHSKRLQTEPYSPRVLSNDSYTLNAVLAEGDLDVHPSGHFVLGFHIAFGTLLTRPQGVNQEMFQFAFKLGARL